MKRLIPRDGAEWWWLACIILELVVTVAHATTGDWFAALNSSLWAGAIFIIAATTRAWKTARRRVAELEARPRPRLKLTPKTRLFDLDGIDITNLIPADNLHLPVVYRMTGQPYSITSSNGWHSTGWDSGKWKVRRDYSRDPHQQWAAIPPGTGPALIAYYPTMAGALRHIDNNRKDHQ